MGTNWCPDLGTIDSAMSGITLSLQEIADLAAFLDCSDPSWGRALERAPSYGRSPWPMAGENDNEFAAAFGTWIEDEDSTLGFSDVVCAGALDHNPLDLVECNPDRRPAVEPACPRRRARHDLLRVLEPGAVSGRACVTRLDPRTSSLAVLKTTQLRGLSAR